MNADAGDADRNLLFAVAALRRGSISADTMLAALKEWSRDKRRPIEQILSQSRALGDEELTRVKHSVHQHLHSHGNDVAKSLAALNAEKPLPAAVSQIADPDLQAALTHFGPASLASAAGSHDPTMGTLAAAPSQAPGGSDDSAMLDRTLAFEAGPPTLPVAPRQRPETGLEPPTLHAGGPPGGGSISDTLDLPQQAENRLRTISFVGDLDATQAPTQKQAHDPAGSAGGPFVPDPTPSALAGNGTAIPSRYRILRAHARGGLGEVYVAFDEELRREVALKEIQRRHATRSDSRLRFLLEAEVTGGLEHPGIVPVYGLGQYADGRPYYAMRFIRGQSLQDAIDRFHLLDAEGPPREPGHRSLEFRELLERFIDVCNAIAYAHSRGVIHRDIKPSNIMLGAFGETLVVDWGLAKPLDRAEVEPATGIEPLKPFSASGKSETQYGSAMGTPQFMSPEQAAGQLEVLGPPSDVYSLGATLYYLLSGKPAFRDLNPASLITNVQRGKFPPPRDVNPRVPAALQAVCLKAMANKPEERYASALLLAADLQHWLADEPVSVYREPLLERMARWAKRHKRLVTTAAAVFLTGVVALIVGTVLIRQEQARTETNFRLARDAVDQMLTELAEVELAEVPQMESVRKKMLGKALEFYQKFLRERGNDRSIRQETGRANLRLGDILEMLGDYDAAEHAYARAIALLSSLVNQDAHHASYRRDLARAHHNLGVLQKKAFRFEEAEKNLNTAHSLRKQLVAEFPQNTDDLRDAKDSVYQLGTLWAKLSGKSKDAEEAYREAVKGEAQLSSAHPGDVEYQRRLARYRNNRGILLRASNPDAAEIEFRDALEIQNPLADQAPTVAGLQWERARTTHNLAGVLDASKLTEAEAGYRKALEGFKKLADGFPSVPDYRFEMAAAYTSLGSLLDRMGTTRTAGDQPGRSAALFREAEADLRYAISLFQGLAEQFPHRPDYPQLLAAAERKLGAVLVHEKRLDDAEASLRQAVEALRKLATAHGQVSEYHASLGQALDNLAKIVYHEGRYAEARPYAEEAIEQFRIALEGRPGNLEYPRLIRSEYRYLTGVFSRLNDHEASTQAAEKLLNTLHHDADADLIAARLMAQAAVLVEQETEFPQRERAERVKTLASRTVAILSQAADDGLSDPAKLDDEIFKLVTSFPEFQQVRARVKARTPAAAGSGTAAGPR